MEAQPEALELLEEVHQRLVLQRAHLSKVRLWAKLRLRLRAKLRLRLSVRLRLRVRVRVWARARARARASAKARARVRARVGARVRIRFSAKASASVRVRVRASVRVRLKVGLRLRVSERAFLLTLRFANQVTAHYLLTYSHAPTHDRTYVTPSLTNLLARLGTQRSRAAHNRDA